jgi:hypothetical protein
MVDVAEVEKRTDLVKARGIEIGTTLGGIVIQSVADLEQISLRLARGMVAVPLHCRDQPGVCYALCMQALEWGMPIMSVINNSYVPRGGDRIGFQSGIIHAVIEKNAPLKSRLRYEIVGEGQERRCKVWGTFKSEEKPHEYLSETLAKMHPGHVTKDNVKYVKGSPLWDTNPEVQMFYSASRQWARLFAPDVLLGAYTPEEIETAQPIDVTPITSLAQRLRDAKKNHAGDRGFDAAHIAQQTGATVIEGDANPGTAIKEASDEDTKGRDGETGSVGGDDHLDGAVLNQDEGGRAAAVGGDQADVEQSAGSAGDHSEAQGEGEAQRSPKPRKRK